jgi:hypothetical protein
MMGGAHPSVRAAAGWAAMGQNSGWAAAGKEWAAGLGCWAAEGLLFFFFFFFFYFLFKQVNKFRIQTKI